MKIIKEVKSSRSDTNHIVVITLGDTLHDATCTCEWTTIEIGRHPNLIDRKFCRHIKEVMLSLFKERKQGGTGSTLLPCPPSFKEKHENN